VLTPKWWPEIAESAWPHLSAVKQWGTLLQLFAPEYL